MKINQEAICFDSRGTQVSLSHSIRKVNPSGAANRYKEILDGRLDEIRLRGGYPTERIVRQGVFIAQVCHVRVGESRSILPLTRCIRTFLLPRRVRHARLCIYSVRKRERAHIFSSTLRSTVTSDADINTYTYIGSRRVEILLFLWLYEPYRRLLRLFRFNDQHPDSSGDSVIPFSPSRSWIPLFLRSGHSRDTWRNLNRYRSRIYTYKNFNYYMR